MKLTSSFKMSKPTKRLLATMHGEDKKIFKAMAINAQLAFDEYEKRKLRSKEKDVEE